MPDDQPRVLVADSIAEDGVRAFDGRAIVDVKTGLSEAEIVAIIGDYQAIIVRSATRVTRPIIEAGTNLAVIGRAGVGVDNIDLEAATERGVTVVNAPLGNTVAAAEHTIALLTALARNVAAADASTRKGEWRRKEFMGIELRGKTLGVVGLGKIGSEVARRAIGLDMKVVAYDPFVPEERLKVIGAESVSFDEMLQRSDFVTVHPPLTAATRGMIGAEEMAKMKDGARLINVARGGIIDEEALVAAVQSGKLAGAAIDVFTEEPPGQSPLFAEPRIIVTPHLGASTIEAQEQVAVDVAEQIVDVLDGRLPRYAVNAPMLTPETMQVVAPYMAVGDLLGSVAMQLITGTLRSIGIDVYGEIAEHDVAPLKASVIRGLMRPISEENVNLVNASVVADSRGWKIEERLRSSHDVFINLIELTLECSGGTVTVGGTMLRAQPNLVSLDGLDVDITPGAGQYLLIADNDDRPGMIGEIGSRLGTYDINISAMQVGRNMRRGRARMLLSLDERPTADQVSQIEAVDGIDGVRVIQL